MNINKNDSSVRILLIDDIEPIFIEYMVNDIQRSFPAATIDVAKGFEGIEDLITNGKYHAIFLDGLLHNWPSHALFGTSGANLIPFILAHSPQSIIIAISGNKEYNKQMVEIGAHKSLDKKYITGKHIISEDFTVAS